MDIPAEELLFSLFVMFLTSCTGERYVEYSVNSTGIPGGSYKMVDGELVYSGPLIHISYVNENGEKEFSVDVLL